MRLVLMRWQAALWALFPAMLACFDIQNPDIGFHVATGRAIDLLGHVPATNVLSFTSPDEPWILHQWIPAYLFHHVDRLAGPAGLVATKMAVVWLTFVFLWLALARRTSDLPSRILWFLLAAVTASPRFFERPLLFSQLGLAAVLWGLTWLPDLRRTAWRVLVPAALVSILHAGFVYIAILCAIVVMAHLVARSGLGVRLSLGFGALLASSAALLTLANPFGARVMLLPFQFSLDPYYREHLIEFRAPELDVTFYPGLVVSLVLGAALLAAALWRRGLGALRDGPFLADAGALACFGFLAVRHERSMDAFALVAAWAAVGWTAEVARHRAVRAIAVAVGIAVALYGTSLWARYAKPGFGVDADHFPAQLFQFVQDQRLDGNAYVSDVWAGHWLWAFYPERRVFYDNRIEAYPRDFFEKVYQSIRYGEPGWEAALYQYDVRIIVMRYATPGERKHLAGRPGLRGLLVASPRWRCVYWDDLGAIYLRADSVPANCARCGHFREFDPDLAGPVRNAPDAVAAELERVLALSGPSERVYVALVRTALWRKDRPTAGRWLTEGLARFPAGADLGRLTGPVFRP